MAQIFIGFIEQASEIYNVLEQRVLAVRSGGIYIFSMRSTSQLIFLFCLFGALILAVSVHAEDAEVHVYFEDYPPYEYLEDGEAKGVNIEFMREAFRRMGVSVMFTPMPWKRGIYELQNGGIMALASGFKTPEREVFAFFPSEWLAMEDLVIVAPVVSGVEVNSLEDLRGLRLGVVREYAYGKKFDSMSNLNKIEAASNPQLMKMLMSHRMDVAIMNKMVARAVAKKMDILAHIKFIYAVHSEPLYLFFSRARGFEAARLSREFSEAMATMRKDGTYQDIESRY